MSATRIGPRVNSQDAAQVGNVKLGEIEMAKRSDSSHGSSQLGDQAAGALQCWYLEVTDKGVIAAAQFVGIDKAFDFVRSRPTDAMDRRYSGCVTQ